MVGLIWNRPYFKNYTFNQHQTWHTRGSSSDSPPPPRNREAVKGRNSAPLAPYVAHAEREAIRERIVAGNKLRAANVMRKCMTYAVEEALQMYPECVYLGEVGAMIS